jgi:hypothetical protein
VKLSLAVLFELEESDLLFSSNFFSSCFIDTMFLTYSSVFLDK